MVIHSTIGGVVLFGIGRVTNIEFNFFTTGFCVLVGFAGAIGVADGDGASGTGATTGVLLAVAEYFCQIKDFFTARQISFVLPSKKI